jgi:hypothetical protein
MPFAPGGANQNKMWYSLSGIFIAIGTIITIVL